MVVVSVVTTSLGSVVSVSVSVVDVCVVDVVVDVVVDGQSSRSRCRYRVVVTGRQSSWSGSWCVVVVLVSLVVVSSVSVSSVVSPVVVSGVVEPVVVTTLEPVESEPVDPDAASSSDPVPPPVAAAVVVGVVLVGVVLVGVVLVGVVLVVTTGELLTAIAGTAATALPAAGFVVVSRRRHRFSSRVPAGGAGDAVAGAVCSGVGVVEFGGCACGDQRAAVPHTSRLAQFAPEWGRGRRRGRRRPPRPPP